MRALFLVVLGSTLLTAAAPALPPSMTFIPGRYGGPSQPDGNTMVFEDSTGLVVVDTGRHATISDQILAVAKGSGKPIRAIVNTHWHLDHSSGNVRLRAAFPGAKLYTGNAVRGALDGFLAGQLGQAKAMYADPKTAEAMRAELKLGIDTMEDRANLIPDMPVTGPTTIPYGRKGLELDLMPHAATGGDTIVYDPATRTLLAGDLVVIPAPFFDTACANGWKRALARIAAVPFVRLVPGHGPIMDRAEFMTYKGAFDRFVDCAQGVGDKAVCIAGWQRSAARFLLTDKDRAAADGLLDYYIDRIIRVPAKQQELCAAT